MSFLGLAKALRRLSEVPSQVSREGAKEIKELLWDQYAGGYDPRGTPWKALAKSTIAKGRKPPPGTETFAMRDSTKAFALSGSGIGLSVGPAYAVYYDAVRNIFPRNTIPPLWAAALKKVLEAQARKILAGGSS